MIRAKGLRAIGPRKGGPAAVLSDVTLEIEPGLTCLLGTAEDGGPLFLDIAAGLVRPSAGSVDVLGGPPAAARARIAHVPHEVALPEALTVSEILTLGRQLRRAPTKNHGELLARLGIAHLATRRASSLARAEARSVALAAAVHAETEVLLLDEPFADASLETPARLGEVLRERARAGAIVVVATASTRPPLAFETTWLLSRGVVFSVNGSEPIALAREARLRVVTPDARALSAALGALEEDAAPRELTIGDGHVVLVGPDILALARALGAAVCSSAARVVAVVPELASVDGLKEAALSQTARSSVPPAAARRAEVAGSTGDPT